MKGNGFISKFSVYRGKPCRGVQLHQYMTFFKLNRSLVLLGVHVKFVLKFRGVKMFLKRYCVCFPMTCNFSVEMKNQLNKL